MLEQTVEPLLGLPCWPDTPEPVDPTAASYLVLCVGADERAVEVAAGWSAAAERLAPTRLVAVAGLDDGRASVEQALDAARTGVRILVVGGQYDVLRTLALAREHGAGPAELRSFVSDAGRATHLPVYCAHCRSTHRMVGQPRGEADCPGCGRRLEIHPHHSAQRGSFLASDVRARELA
ncbi:dimethylamine monooxygenase subunit DmmA family protein [soil metagenome]